MLTVTAVTCTGGSDGKVSLLVTGGATTTLYWYTSLKRCYLISNRAATDPVGGSGVAIPNINNTPTVVDGLLAGGYYLIVSDPNCADNKVIQFVTVSPPSGIANYYILHANMRSTFLLHRPVR